MPASSREHALAAEEATVGILLIDAGEDRRERAGVVAAADERVREQAMAGQVIGAIGDRAAIGVDRERARCGAERARAARRRTGAGRRGREQIDDRAVDARRARDGRCFASSASPRPISASTSPGASSCHALAIASAASGLPRAIARHHVGELAGERRDAAVRLTLVGRRSGGRAASAGCCGT